MRASEFITETRTLAKPTKRQQNASVGMFKFRDPSGYDRTYELNRIMMAVACADGINPLTIDAESWSGRFNTAHPYTEEERDMLKHAYSAVGSEIHDLNGDDLVSREMPNTNVISPVTGFKGWK